jgi:hypothetical protein
VTKVESVTVDKSNGKVGNQGIMSSAYLGGKQNSSCSDVTQKKLEGTSVDSHLPSEGLSEEDGRTIERLKNVAIKPRWAADQLARQVAVDVIATYGASVIPVLLEISKRADDTQTRERAIAWLMKIR